MDLLDLKESEDLRAFGFLFEFADFHVRSGRAGCSSGNFAALRFARFPGVTGITRTIAALFAAVAASRSAEITSVSESDGGDGSKGGKYKSCNKDDFLHLILLENREADFARPSVSAGDRAGPPG